MNQLDYFNSSISSIAKNVRTNFGRVEALTILGNVFIPNERMFLNLPIPHI